MANLQFPNLRLSRLLVLLCLAPLAAQAQSAESLSQTKKLYVDSFGQDKNATDVREQLMRRLEKSHGVELTQSATAADAVLKGTVQIWATGRIAPGPRSHAASEPTFEGYLSVEIVGKNNQTLWSYLVTPSKFPLGGITDDLAAQLVARLLAEIKEKNQQPPDASGAVKDARAALRGAGATFPAPLYQKWFELFEERHPDLQIHYDAVGSAEGIAVLTSGAVDFGASDMPLTDQAMAGVHRRFVQVPVALGAVVPIYNVPQARELRFTPEILAGIYLGKIKKWNDPEIRAANRGASLPDADIAVLHRADGSGTTFVWTNYLSKVSAEWKSSVGEGLTVHWPIGTGAAYNDGVASAVQQTPNSIGYVEFIYAIQHELSFAPVKNAAGHYVKADIASVTAAVQNSGDSSADLRVSITNSPAGAAYPISTYTWLLLPDQIKDAGKRSALLELARWMLTSGQKSCSALGYAPLPNSTAKRALDSLSSIK